MANKGVLFLASVERIELLSVNLDRDGIGMEVYLI